MKQLTVNTIAKHFFLVWVSLGSVVITNSVQKLPAVSAVGIDTPNYNSLASHHVPFQSYCHSLGQDKRSPVVVCNGYMW